MHTIRLRGPWEYQPLAHTSRLPDGSVVDQAEIPPPPPGRVTMPCDWGATLGHSFRGRVRYARHFHRPTGLTPGAVVRVTLTDVDGRAQVFLNGELLGMADGPTCPVQFEVTTRLQNRNRLEIEVDLPHESDGAPPLPRRPGREGLGGGLIGEVLLEIDED